MNTNTLQRTGLTSKESQVYLTLVHNGKLPVASLAKKSGIKRATVYLVLGALGEKGLVKQAVIGKRTYYLPESPAKISRLLAKQKSEFDLALPALEAVFKKSAKEPEVFSYYGKDGIRRIYTGIQDEALWAKTIFSPQSFCTVFSHAESLAFSARFAERDAILRSLLPDDAVSRKLIASNARKGYSKSNKLLPKTYTLSVNSIVWGDSVALISYENLFGIVINNAEIARYFENQFDWWWKTLN